MKKVTLIEIIDFNSFLKELQDKQLPIKLAYKIYSVAEAIEKDVSFYYSELQKILQNYAEVKEDGSYEMSEDGTQIIIQKDKIEVCEKELNELASCEKELDIPSITIDELDEIDDTFTISTIAVLKPFLSE